MNKNDILWVVIRAVGLVFLVLSSVSFVRLASVFSYFIYASDIVANYGLPADSAAGKEVAMNTVKAMAFQSFTNLMLYGVAAYYFMRKGKFVHSVIAK